MDQRTATVSTLTFFKHNLLHQPKSDMASLLIQALKEILFGSPMACFTEEWKQQNFTFSDIPDLKYGIMQKKVLC